MVVFQALVHTGISITMLLENLWELPAVDVEAILVEQILAPGSESARDHRMIPSMRRYDRKNFRRNWIFHWSSSPRRLIGMLNPQSPQPEMLKDTLKTGKPHLHTFCTIPFRYPIRRTTRSRLLSHRVVHVIFTKVQLQDLDLLPNKLLTPFAESLLYARWSTFFSRVVVIDY